MIDYIHMLTEIVGFNDKFLQLYLKLFQTVLTLNG